jgi:ankyrin repeat protein
MAHAEATTRLYAAAVSGNGSLVGRLLEAGADTNHASAGPGEGPPLCAAACWGHQDAVDALIAHGADPTSVRTPTPRRCTGRHAECITKSRSALDVAYTCAAKDVEQELRSRLRPNPRRA